MVLLDVVIDHAGVRTCVEDGSALVVGEEVHALIDVFVETHYPFEVLCANRIRR